MGGPVKKLVPVMLLFAALLPCTCHNNPPVPQGQLDLVVDGRQILVEPGLSRFFPDGSRDGEPLLAYIRLAVSDSSQLPVGLEANRAWAASTEDVWETGLTEHAAKKTDYQSAYYAEGGPRWTPGLTADVTVRIIQSGGGTWDILIRDCVVVAVQQY